MKKYLADHRGIDAILSAYSHHVQSAATAALSQHGFLGLDPRPDAPSTFEELKAFWDNPDRSRYFPVYNGGSDKTVFNDAATNLLFRAWHDILHVTLNAPFDLKGEYMVANAQAAVLSGIDKEIVYADVVDQTQYFLDHGEYVDDQRSFVVAHVFGAVATPEATAAA